MAYNYGGYNPLQARMESLMQQKQMIEQQLSSLQGMNNVPAINITNNTTPPPPVNNFDGNFKWVDNEEQARQLASSLPLILFDNNNPLFYMKNVDGSFKKFRFEEIIETSVQTVDPQIENRMNALEGKLNDILNAITGVSSPNDTTTPSVEKIPQTEPKTTAKGGSKNG